jgi:hypothetical protein
MWYVTRNLDDKEFMLVSLNIEGVNGVACDGEKVFIKDGEFHSMIKK